MRILTICTLGLCASMAWAQPATTPTLDFQPPRAPTQPEEIEGAIKGFASALSERNVYFRAAPFVFGAKIGYYGGPQWGEIWEKQRGEARLNVERTEVFDLKGDDARAHVFYRWNAPLFRSEILQETVSLRRFAIRNRRGSEWKIVPLPLDGAAPQLSTGSRPVLNDAAFVILNTQIFTNNMRATNTLSNLKQLSSAAFRFALGMDEIYAFAPEYAEKAISPYLPDARAVEIWKVPEQNEKYTFNANLSAKGIRKIANPAQTVLFYEGADEKPVFRYDGKAAIAFADGHAALVSPEEAKKLIWKP